MKKTIFMIMVVILLANGVAYAGFLSEYGNSKPSTTTHCSATSTGGLVCR